jgi:hypothetical protein
LAAQKFLSEVIHDTAQAQKVRQLGGYKRPKVCILAMGSTPVAWAPVSRHTYLIAHWMLKSTGEGKEHLDIGGFVDSIA